MFTLSPCPQGNNCKAEEKKGKLWRVTRMWLGRKEDDKCLLLQVRKWIRDREENMRVKKRHSVSEQNDSDSLPSQRHNHGPSFPSSFYYTIRRFRPDRRFFILQWNKAGMKWRKILHTSIWISFILNVHVLCRQVIIQIIPAPRQYGHQHRAGSGIPLIVQALWRWIRDGSDDGPAARCRQRLAGPG